MNAPTTQFLNSEPRRRCRASTSWLRMASNQEAKSVSRKHSLDIFTGWSPLQSSTAFCACRPLPWLKVSCPLAHSPAAHVGVDQCSLITPADFTARISGALLYGEVLTIEPGLHCNRVLLEGAFDWLLRREAPTHQQKARTVTNSVYCVYDTGVCQQSCPLFLRAIAIFSGNCRFSIDAFTAAPPRNTATPTKPHTPAAWPTATWSSAVPIKVCD